MSLLTDLIDADIAALERIVPVPTGELGYGVDLSCVTDLTPDLKEVDPNSVQGMGESVIRFLTAERDSIPDAPGRGFNIYRLLASGLTPDDIHNAQAAISAEVEEDDRFESATATLEVVGLKSIKIAIRIVPVDPALGAFDLILAVSDGELLYDLVSQQ